MACLSISQPKIFSRFSFKCFIGENFIIRSAAAIKKRPSPQAGSSIVLPIILIEL